MNVALSLFGHLYDSPHPWTGSWADFLAGLQPFEECPPSAKDGGQLKGYSPAVFRPGAARSAKAVVSVSFGVLDLDDVTPAALEAVLAKVEAQGLAAALHTTWSHPKAQTRGLVRARLLVPFDHPVDAADWPTFWAALAGHFGVPVDAQCKDPNRLYYIPAVPVGSPEDSKVFLSWEGQPLQTGAMLRSSAVPRRPEGNAKIGKERLSKVAQKWKRSTVEFRSYMGQVLTKVLDGEVYAEPGQRDTTAFQLCQDLAKVYPDLDPDHLAALFAQSHQLMGWEPTPTIQEKLRRALDTVAAEENAQKLAEVSDRKVRIAQAFAGQEERDYPYTPQELAKFSRDAKCSDDEFGKRWIIQRGPAFYLFLSGSYHGPYSEKDVFSAVLRDLAPASSAGVELWTESEAGGPPRRKTVSELVAAYGSVAQAHVLDLTATKARYDVTTRTLVEAPCPVRDLTPTYYPDVAAYLEIMAGPFHTQLLDWIAQVTNLEDTCVALLLTGAPGTGKSLLAHGLAKLWTEDQPTDLESAMSNFNEALARCPLILADEQVPKDWRGHGRSAELRQLLATRSRPYRKKYAHESVILGAVRVIVTANNENILATPENLSSNDIAAIGERFFHLPVQEAAKEWLGMCDTRAMVEGQIARHALWLKANHKPAKEGRFLIRPRDMNFHHRLTTKTGIRSDLCQVLVGYLLNPGPANARGDLLIRVKDHRLLVNVQGLINVWPNYVLNAALPSTGRLSQGLAGISEGRRGVQVGSRLVQYRAIRTDHLKAWAEEHEYATAAEVDAALAIDTPEKRGQVVRLVNP